MNFTKEFKLFLKARYPILYISTTEEERLEYTIKSAIKESNINRVIYTWDFIDGYLGNPSDNGFGARNPLQALELVQAPVEPFDPEPPSQLQPFAIICNPNVHPLVTSQIAQS